LPASDNHSSIAAPNKMLAILDNQHDHAFATGRRFTPRSPLPFSSRLSRYMGFTA